MKSSSKCDPASGMSALVADALARYGLSRHARATFVRHGENTTYRVTAGDGRRYALRVHRPEYQTAEAIRSELSLPDGMEGKHITHWSERIMLPSFPFNDGLAIPIDPDEDIDVQVRRRAS